MTLSHSQRILARLQRGPATAAELYGLHAIVHSRVAELRKRGHRIECVRTPGESGPHAYVYSLSAPTGAGTPSPVGERRPLVRVFGVGSAGGGVPRRENAPAAEQLTLADGYHTTRIQWAA